MKIRCLIVLCCLFANLFSAYSALAGSSASLWITVLSEKGIVLPDANISIFPVTSAEGKSDHIDEGASELVTKKSIAEGVFCRELSPGSYRIGITANGWRDVTLT